MKLSSFMQMKLNLLICQSLGWRITSSYIAMLGKLYFLANPKEKKRLESSIAEAFVGREKSIEMHRLRKEVLRGLFRHYYEKLYNAYSSVEGLSSFLSARVDNQGMRALDEALMEKKGVLLVTGHFGGVEFIPGYLASKGYAVTITVRFSSGHLRARSLEKAAKFATRIVDVDRTHNIMKAICDNLRENRIVITECDEIEEWRPHGNDVNWFLGKCMRLDRTLDVLARRTGANVVFGLMQREDDQRYKLVMTSLRNLRNSFNPSIGFSPSRVILNLLEEYIYKYPEQWYQWGKYSKIRVIPQDVIGFEKANLLSQLEPGFRQVLTAGLG